MVMYKDPELTSQGHTKSTKLAQLASTTKIKKAILRCFILAQDGTSTSEIQQDLYELSHCKWKTCCSSSSEAEIRGRNRQRKAESSFPVEKLFVI